jgi:uncharacterized protein
MGPRRDVTATIAYLDASAAVKLLRREPETKALIDSVGDAASWVSSELLDVEVRCAARRLGGRGTLERAGKLLDAVELVPYTQRVRTRAGAAFSPPQRALDAIHLASALDLALDDLVLITYDRDQARAGKAAGLNVLSPGP